MRKLLNKAGDRVLSASVRALNAFIKAEDGQSMAEYGLIIALVAVVAIAALTPLGTKIASTFSQITQNL